VVALLIIGLVHSISFFQKLVPANDTEKQLLDLMSNYKFDLAGSLRSMGDLMTGLVCVSCWRRLPSEPLTSCFRVNGPGLLKRVAFMNILWLAAMTAFLFIIFLLSPLRFWFATLLIFVLAWWKLPAKGLLRQVCTAQFVRTLSLTKVRANPKD